MSRHRRAAPSISAAAPTAPRLRSLPSNGPAWSGLPRTAAPVTGVPSSVTLASRLEREPGGSWIDEEQREPVGRLRRHEQDARDVSPRDELLPTRERPAPRGRLRARLDRVGAPVEIGVEERDRRPRVAGGDRREPALLLRVAAGLLDRPGGEHRREVRAGAGGAAHLLEEDRALDHPEGAPAVRLRQREPEPAELGHLLPQRLALAARVIPEETHGGGRHVLVEERARRVLQELLVGAEREVHGVTPSGGRRALPWAGRGHVRR